MPPRHFIFSPRPIPRKVNITALISQLGAARYCKELPSQDRAHTGGDMGLWVGAVPRAEMEEMPRAERAHCHRFGVGSSTAALLRFHTRWHSVPEQPQSQHSPCTARGCRAPPGQQRKVSVPTSGFGAANPSRCTTHTALLLSMHIGSRQQPEAPKPSACTERGRGRISILVSLLGLPAAPGLHG